MAEKSLKEQLAELDSKALKQNGEPRADAKQEDLDKIAELEALIEKEDNKSQEVLDAEAAHAKATEEAEAAAKEREDDLEADVQKVIMDRRIATERVARRLEKEEKARKKIQSDNAAKLKKELATPLSFSETFELTDLERRANKGKHQPDSYDMNRLANYRIRAKLKG